MSQTDPDQVAERIHAAAIRLLRRVRSADAGTGVSPPKLSALSVLAFVGPQSLSALARAEQVSAPTMSKTVADLEEDGLVAKKPDPADGRGLVIQVTPKGRSLMEQGRRRRLAILRRGMADFSQAELRTLEQAATLMLRASEI